MNVYVVHFSGEWKKAIILVINGSRRHYDSEVTFCWSEKNLLAMLLSHVVMIMDEWMILRGRLCCWFQIPKISEIGIWNLEFGIWNLEFQKKQRRNNCAHVTGTKNSISSQSSLHIYMINIHGYRSTTTTTTTTYYGSMGTSQGYTYYTPYYILLLLLLALSVALLSMY